MNLSESIKKKNRTALLLLLISVVLAAVILSLPAYKFTSSVYTKKSANTFVGDEKYTEVRAEVDAVAEEYRASGLDVTVSESVTERTNSKGETTSMVAFSVDQTFTKNGWSFLSAGMGSTWVLMGLLLCLVLSAACALAGTVGSLGDPYRTLDGRAAAFRSASYYLALIAMLLVPVFFMVNTVLMSRRVDLYCDGLLTEGKEALFAKLDAFLFGGQGGEELESMLKGLSFHNTGAMWLQADP